MTTQTSNTSTPAIPPIASLGEVGYSAYGDTPGPNGPWSTYDGRTMPSWGELEGGIGGLTRERWHKAAEAIVAEHERRKRAERVVRFKRLIGNYSLFAARYEPEDDSFELTARDGSGEIESVSAEFLEALERVEPQGVRPGGAARHCLRLFGLDLGADDSAGQLDPLLVGLSEISSAVRDLAEANAHAMIHGNGTLQQLIVGVTKQLHARVKLLAPDNGEDTASTG